MNPHSVLLIEDNHDDYEAIERGFNSIEKNYPLTWFSSSEKALSFLTEETNAKDMPNLIILDLNMPGLDGRECLGILKSSAHLKEIPVIVMTTSTDEGDVSACYQKGANTYVQKPVKFSRMKEICGYLHNYWFNAAVLPESTQCSNFY